jgi:hypothetical protein
MFEKIKDYLWNERKRDGFCYFHHFGADFNPVCNVSNKNMRYVEIKKEDLKYEKNGWANVIEYIRFTDDNSGILLTIPEFIEPILKCTELHEKDFPADKIYDLLINLLNEKAEKLGLCIDNNTNLIYDIIFGADKNTELNLSKKQEHSIRYYSGKYYNGDYDFILPEEFNESSDYSINYGTLIDNKIVSYSGNTYTFALMSENEIINISIHTLEDYRNRGYAISNVVAMAENIMEFGKIVTYTTHRNNIASQKTALAAGLSEIMKTQRFWYEKNKFGVSVLFK